MKHHLVCVFVMLVAATACAQGAGGSAADAGSEVVARYGDEEITLAELEEQISARLIALRQQEYEMKRQQLEQTIFEALVARAAEAEGIPQSDYIKVHVTDKVDEPSEENIAKVLAQYRTRLNPDEEKARQQVVTFLTQQKTAALNKELRERLFAEGNVRILLEPMRFEAGIEDYSPTRGGGEDAAITLIEYTDFQCPFCARIQTTLDDILARYGGNVRHVFKHLPLPMHAQARLGAEASMCAADQGKFWEMHDWLFANKSQINRDALQAEATTLELDVDLFNACLDDQKHADVVQADMKEANRLGITGTPGFLINGRMLKGAQPTEEFYRIINDELQRAGIPIPEEPKKGEEETGEQAS